MIINLFHDVIHTTFSLFIGDIFTFFWNIIVFIFYIVFFIFYLLYELIVYIGHLFYHLIISIGHFFSSIGHFFSSIGYFIYHHFLISLVIIVDILITIFSPPLGGILGIVIAVVLHFSGNFLDDFISKSLDDSSNETEVSNVDNSVKDVKDMIEVSKKVNDARKDAKVIEEVKVGISLLKAAKSLKR